MEHVPDARATWTFLTNHARVLVQIWRDPGVRVRDIAARCLLTERAVQRIITDLEDGGYLTHTRVGRTNRYQVTAARPLRHPADAGPTVAELLALLTSHEPATAGHVDGAPTAARGEA
ncbi:AsnC family transcriptional regulator [Streptacidiphilus pinicola]|uniref:AsnC family transcriptional regulator n=1 Tax=Streptacidiphilus pinicola TaxID=2219663 RepID=A0A2X0I6I1_9ACTN|nr:helix-turn-helix domain-containing protein [Streptacidiphilus pinicola]RAG80572.1 AsnC family transcriptional regulator [Streptacidiphilus pinicola]